MDNQAVQPIRRPATNAVEVIVYVKSPLDADQRQAVVTALEGTDGILQAEFCPLRNHLVLTRYDRDTFSSQDVQKSFTNLNLDVRLVGPV